MLYVLLDPFQPITIVKFDDHAIGVELDSVQRWYTVTPHCRRWRPRSLVAAAPARVRFVAIAREWMGGPDDSQSIDVPLLAIEPIGEVI